MSRELMKNATASARSAAIGYEATGDGRVSITPRCLGTLNGSSGSATVDIAEQPLGSPATMAWKPTGKTFSSTDMTPVVIELLPGQAVSVNFTGGSNSPLNAWTFLASFISVSG